MTTSERSTIDLRMIGADYPDGEIPLDRLARIAETTQLLAHRLARAEEGRGGPGRSPKPMAEGVRLMLTGIEAGSTKLRFAGPPRDASFDLGSLTDAVIERTFASLVDGVDAAASGQALPDSYDDLSRRGLADLLDSLAQAAPEVEVEGRVGAREPKVVRLRPSEVSASLKSISAPEPAAPAAITVEGILYSVNLHTGRYRIQDDMGWGIDLVTSLFTSEHIAPLLDQRVSAAGTPIYDDAGQIKEIDATTISPAQPIEGLDPSAFWHNMELDELLAGVKPIESLDDLRIPGLTEEEGEAFLRVLRE